MEKAVAALAPLFLSLLGLILWWQRGVIGLLGIRHRFINSWSRICHRFAPSAPANLWYKQFHCVFFSLLSSSSWSIWFLRYENCSTKADDWDLFLFKNYIPV